VPIIAGWQLISVSQGAVDMNLSAGDFAAVFALTRRGEKK